MSVSPQKWVIPRDAQRDDSKLVAKRKLGLTYLAHFSLPTEIALVRLDGQYGDAAVVAQLIEAGVSLITRGRGYHMLEHPQLQRALTHPPTTSVTSKSSNEVIDLFEGGWLQMGDGLPQARVIIARHQAPAPGKAVTVGKLIGEWVYELASEGGSCPL